MLMKTKSETTGNPLVYAVERVCTPTEARHYGVLMATFMVAENGYPRWHLDVKNPRPVYAPPDVAEHYEAMTFDVVYEWTYNAETGREVFAPVVSS